MTDQPRLASAPAVAEVGAPEAAAAMAPLVLVARLVEELSASRVRYCHFKSNDALDRSASGENDLDLLISRADSDRFHAIVSALGFKPACDPAGRRLPGVEDFYGFDVETERLVHLHAHFQLVIGHDATKAYRMPLESAYLESTRGGELFPTPPPEIELIVFVIRMMLKHGTWDVTLMRQGHLTPAEYRELRFLVDRVEDATLESCLRRHVPFIRKELFDRCLAALEPGRSRWSRITTARRLEARLRACRRRGRATDVLTKFWRRASGIVSRRLLKRRPKKVLLQGGALIAFVGSDGAGKSTMIEAISSWLDKEFKVERVHIGKPPWSRTTFLLRGLLKLGRTLRLYPFQRVPTQYSLDTSSLVFPGYPWAIRELCTARDRYLAYRRSRRRATNGTIVLSDRYPIPAVKLMEGPQIRRFAGNDPNRLLRWLARREESYYLPIQPPELLIVLRIEPQRAVERKPEEDAEFVRSRAGEIWAMDWDGLGATVIDASEPRAELTKRVKSLVWGSL